MLLPALSPPLPPRLRRPAKLLGFCALGYALFWATSALGILGASAWAREQVPTGGTVAGIHHFERVDDRVWRGSAPGPEGYRELARRGVHTVVDLRAEDLTPRQLAQPQRAGLTAVRLPIRDGQTPAAAQVDAFLATVRGADGPVFVHCGAGVGRTGSMAAAYLVRTGQATARAAALRTVAVGPPSIEQIYYAATAERHESEQPPALVRAVSRLADAPRRISSYL
ncbi:protein-tyrosine phosphatase family protein [Streptomyces boninensis]|uniref:protein-tyrosine phosphatase family protein n=1 Tax=Streptomyces boninensis TaxID=2039455 RepID=UPI003B2102CA